MIRILLVQIPHSLGYAGAGASGFHAEENAIAGSHDQGNQTDKQNNHHRNPTAGQNRSSKTLHSCHSCLESCHHRMSCRPDPAHSCLGCSLHTLGNLLCCLGSFLSIGSSPLSPLDSFSTLFDGLGYIGLGLGCRLQALDGLLTIQSFRSTFPGCSLIALCTAGSLVFDTSRFKAFLDLLAGEPCHFSAPIICHFCALLGRGFRTGQHLISGSIGRSIASGFLLAGKGCSHGLTLRLVFGMKPHLLPGGFRHDPRLIEGSGLSACRLCFYLFQDLTSFIGYVPRV